MGTSQSKKPQQKQQTDTLVQNNNNNNIHNNVEYETADLLCRADRQEIEKIKNDLRDTPELFILNNMIMCVMFFEDYKKCVDQLLQTKLHSHKEYFSPDTIFEKVNENIVCRPYHGPKKHESEPLLPKRYFVFNEAVRVMGTTEENVDVEEINKTVVRIEESPRKGFVRLRELNTTHERTSGSPILRLESTQESHSRSSTDSSDTAYTALRDLKTPKPIDIIRGLEQQTTSGLPRTCISYRKIKKISWDPEEMRGEEISEDDLYETVSYINSKSYMKEIQTDTFLNKVASTLDLNVEDIYESKVVQEKIHCNISKDGETLPCEIIPSIKAKWPLEQTLKFMMKADRSPELRKRYIFPTASMIKEITSLDCVLLPKGYLYKHGERNDSDIEWELNFPQAQKYLENFMSQAQMKSLLLLLTLHKTYIEPKTLNVGLSTEHLRNFILLECESNFSEWPEHRLGTKLITVIKKLNGHLSKPRPCIPDFFITDKNTLSEVPTRQIRKAQKVLDDILQAPVMYFMRALRNLRYTNGKTFFPPLDFKKLYELLKKSGFEFSNPHLVEKKKIATYSQPEMMVMDFEDYKKRQMILRQRREAEEREKNLKNEEERKGSVDSIDVNWQCEKKFDIHKVRALLKFFIEILMDIAEKSLKISTTNSSLFYVKQAYYLTRILQEQSPAFTDEVVEYLEKLYEMEQLCEQKKANKGQNGRVAFTKKVDNNNNMNKNLPKVPLLNGMRNNSARNGQQGLPRKSVTFVEVHKNAS